MVKALLLQKNYKNDGNPPPTFEMTASASKEPIAIFARGECAKLTRLAMEDGDTVRSFAERCKSELRYCTWLRELHAPAPSRDVMMNVQARDMAKQIDDDIDTQLFHALASSLPFQLAYMRTNVEDRSRVGLKFSALCLALEEEADFQKENTNSHSKISFLDQHQEGHSANVALASRIAKDPRGTPVTERISETYKKNVSTDFKLKKRDKRRLEDADDSDEKDETPIVNKLQEQQQTLDPVLQDLWNHVYVLDSHKTRSSAQRDLPCFDFAKGRCKRNPCIYSHEPAPQTDSSSADKTNKSTHQSSPTHERYRSRSPRKRQLPVRFQLSPPPRTFSWL